MKKRGKLILLFISVIILLFVIFNFNEIKFGLNMAKSYNDTPDTDGEELTQEEKDLLSGAKNPLVVILEKNIIEKDEESAEASKNNENQKDESKKDNTTNEDKSKDDFKETITKYNGEFTQLQSEFESKLSGLVSSGYSEYQEGVSPGKLAPKYLGKGADLEAQCDTKFYTMLGSLEDDLKKSGEDTSLINDLKTYYNSYKEAKRGEIMSKVRGHL